MAAFSEADLDRFDAEAIISPPGGIAVIEERRHVACRNWLVRHGYAIDSLDFRAGLSEAVVALGSMMRRHERFGYSLEPTHRNLDALHDGFEVEIPDGGGRVLEILGAESGYREDADWMREMLWIAQLHSLRHLALGRRFFALVVIQEEESPLVGVAIGRNALPVPYWSPWHEQHEFLC